MYHTLFVRDVMGPLRILVVDDHKAARQGICALLALQTDWFVCGEANDGVEALAEAKRLRPDVVLMDISMPRMDGFAATRIIMRELPQSAVIIVSQIDAGLMQKAARDVGAKGFVDKAKISQDLIKAIEIVASDKGAPFTERIETTSNPPSSVNLTDVYGGELEASDRERYRQELARVTLDSMVQFVGLLDAKGVVLEINHVALDAVGVKLGDVEGKPFWTTFWWQVSDEVNATLRESIRRASQGEFVRWEAEIYGRAGGKETIIIDASLMPVKDAQGKVIFITAEGRDITEMKAHEREIARQREELAKLNELKTRFFANITHEFRTPLALMIGPLEDTIADSEGLSTTDRERLEMARRNSLRLLKLVNTLLDFSRIEAGRFEASYEPTDLARVTAELASVFRSAIERASMRLVIDCPPLQEMVYVDREMWEKIIFNLLSNAFKFTFEGEIEVSLRLNGSNVEMTVRDTGTGIQADEIPRLFERFRSVKGARGRSYEGSGIGLALVQELIKLHGGSVRVESTLDLGSAFIVTLPLGKDHLPVDRIGVGRTVSSTELGGEIYVQEALRWLPEHNNVPDVVQVMPAFPSSEAPSRLTGEVEQPSRILLADDNADMREYVQRLLRAHYEVVAVADGESALKSARDFRPDLIVADIMMPRLDGFGLLRAVRADRNLKSIPVILLSARAGEESRVEGLDAGADDYLPKPFSARELMARVRSHLAMEKVRREAEERERKLRAEAEFERNRIRELFMQAPAAIGLLSGPEHRWTFINAEYLRVTGRLRAEDFIGKTVRESLPEIEGQGFFELLDTVYESGVPYVGTVAKAFLNRVATGQPEEAYFNFVYQPVRNFKGNVEEIQIHAVEVTHLELAKRELRSLSDGLELQVSARTHELEQQNGEILRQSEQLRELSNRLLKTQDDERRHIARELHDSAGQLIAALGMSLASINQQARENPSVVKALGNAQNLVQELNKEIRTTSYLLHPPMLDENGLSQAIQWYMEGLRERGGLEIELDISAEFGRLPADLELAIFRIVQESLTNIHRHSFSKTAKIRLSRSIHTVLLEVQDQGKGISPDKLAAIKAQRTGVGITGMRERVRQFKGELEIESKGIGATISVTFPMPPGVGLASCLESSATVE